MRLLFEEEGVLKLTSDAHSSTDYAILSHTWGRADDEVTFQDLCDNDYAQKWGFRKIQYCLQQAKADGYDYVWVDTCCIDKRDRNELGEAINCMFEWYKNAAVCYVYLEDVIDQYISNSRWFTRGWTLQELIAPKVLKFYSNKWHWLGDRVSLREQILAATSIDTVVKLSEVSLPDRFRWSLSRQTTKPEDGSYCLIGLLEVSLLFNYGEGAVRAQQRLLEAVAKEHGARISRAISQSVVASQSQIPLTPESLLESLKFGEMNVRRTNIKEPFMDTCQWILSHPQFEPWSHMKSQKRFLWMQGNAGAGKSTLLRFMERTCVERNRSRAVPVISFYFSARGDLLERTVLGMYRSLLCQILEVFPRLQVLLIHEHSGAISGQPWTTRTLEIALSFCIKNLPVSMQCFIDALDECETSEVQQMLDFLLDLARSYNQLFVCFASRYYPTLSIAGAEELHLGQQQAHTQDIRDFVRSRLQTPDTLHGDELKESVVLKSRGIFFWVVLVVALLNKELRSGSVYNIKTRLEGLPEELAGILNEIVHRDADEMDRLRISLQWTLFSRRPLGVEEYYFAVVNSLSLIDLARPDDCAQPWDATSPSLDQMMNFVPSSSRGLCEVISDDTNKDKRTVQLIHESVREFLLYRNGLRMMCPNAPGELISWSHECLRDSCMVYIAIDFQLMSWTPGLVKTDERYHHVPPSLGKHYPLAYYAFDSVVYHAEQAAATIDQYQFLKRLDTDLLARSRVRALWGIVEDMTGYGLMHLLAFFDAKRLIDAACKLGYDVNNIDPGVSPLFVSAINHRHEATKTLLSHGAHLRTTKTKDQSPLATDESPLMTAISFHNALLCQILLENGANVQAKSSRGETVLAKAIRGRALKCLDVLLRHGASATVRDQYGHTAFHACLDKPDILKILLEKSQDVVATRELLPSLLEAAKLKNNRAVLRTLRAYQAREPVNRSSKEADGESDDEWPVLPIKSLTSRRLKDGQPDPVRTRYPIKRILPQKPPEDSS